MRSIPLGSAVAAGGMEETVRPQGSTEGFQRVPTARAQGLSDLGQKRQKLFDDATKEGKVLEISSLRERMEATKAEYAGPDRAGFVRGIDQWIFKLEAKYGTSIPIDEAAKILDEFDAKNRS
jgi:hypothetical protein